MAKISTLHLLVIKALKLLHWPCTCIWTLASLHYLWLLSQVNATNYPCVVCKQNGPCVLTIPGTMFMLYYPLCWFLVTWHHLSLLAQGVQFNLPHRLLLKLIKYSISSELSWIVLCFLKPDRILILIWQMHDGDHRNVRHRRKPILSLSVIEITIEWFTDFIKWKPLNVVTVTIAQTSYRHRYIRC